VNRIPVNILYAVTQLTWFWSTFVPTMTLSSSSSSFRLLLLALFCRIASVHLAASSSCGTSSKCKSEWIDRVVRRTKLTDALRALSTVGENLPPASASSEVFRFDNEKSLEVRVGVNLGTWRVCRCTNRFRSGCGREPVEEPPGALLIPGRAGGEENRFRVGAVCVEVVEGASPLARLFESCWEGLMLVSVVMGDKAIGCWSSEVLSPFKVRFEGDLGRDGCTGAPFTSEPDIVLSPLLCLGFLLAGSGLFRPLSERRIPPLEMDGGLPVLECALSLLFILSLVLPYGKECRLAF